MHEEIMDNMDKLKRLIKESMNNGKNKMVG